MTDSTTTQIKDLSANPAPLGLLGFGMTTVLLNFHNAGFYELNSMILAMGLCYGGTAQVTGRLSMTTAALVAALVTTPGLKAKMLPRKLPETAFVPSEMALVVQVNWQFAMLT